MSNSHARAVTPDPLKHPRVRVNRDVGSVTMYYLAPDGAVLEHWCVATERYSEAKLRQWEAYVDGQELAAAAQMPTGSVVYLVKDD